MSIRISEIHIQQLGPLGRFNINPGRLNVVYGRNESGKTHLVEFVIRSLFRNPKPFRLRSVVGQGKVVVEGLEGKPVPFSPTSSKKLEDYWEQSDFGFPSDISKLLIVKGADTSLSVSEGGADRSVLGHYLSGMDLCDRIMKRIPGKVQDAKIEGIEILGKKGAGELSDRDQWKERLDEIERLFSKIDQDYSGGPRKKWSDEKAKIEEEIQLLLRAKRHLAFCTAERINSLEKESRNLDDESIRSLREKVYNYFVKDSDLKNKAEKLDSVQKKSKHYDWLKIARNQYKAFMQTASRQPKLLFILSAALFELFALI